MAQQDHAINDATGSRHALRVDVQETLQAAELVSEQERPKLAVMRRAMKHQSTTAEQLLM
jgi:hypothetical protein